MLQTTAVQSQALHSIDLKKRQDEHKKNVTCQVKISKKISEVICCCNNKKTSDNIFIKILMYVITKLGFGTIHSKNLLYKRGLNYITLQQSTIQQYNSRNVQDLP